MIKSVSTNVFHGTVKDFVDAGLQVNGQKIDAVGLSVFGRYKMLPVVGEQKPARGRSAAIYEIDTSAKPEFSFKASAAETKEFVGDVDTLSTDKEFINA